MAHGELGEVFGRLLTAGEHVAITLYDGSVVGDPGSPHRIDVRSPTALSYVFSAPGELGLARAYVTGHLDVHGDLYTVLRALTAVIDGLSIADKLWIMRRLGTRFLRSVPVPAEEAPGRVKRGLRGLRHSKSRDSAAISQHYDVSNHFYELVLGPSMAYTCACYPEEDSTLEEAQFHKFDLVCRKLALEPGMRLLDVGCGWGGMVAHAAEHYGVRAIGVTLSREQAQWGQKNIVARGLADRAEVRHLDYRDVAEGGFDAVSSIGLTEHIGARNLPSYFRFLHSKLREGGRLLNHCITRPTTREPAHTGPFIDRYVFPDGELEGVGTIISAMQDHGFEVRHSENLREHYARTLAAWCANLDANWSEAVQEAGVRRARVWALYMAASRLGFERHKIELQQVLGVKVAANGDAAMPLRPDWGV
ncbi:SAM-dependent methyltransferase [Prauserella sp. PE36]|uniref:Class I SAM-dependent methyltransferase n=1 Tax=Prauserella endophytica TaxID=1592324 RepID=A0ABY2S980_9PSEU|nr:MULTISPECIES: cyclopropane-fatty-acyl-phospholipid synthase family protein [Prauserella]PXY25966.1 cyclopropane-fatty-acyl-phospholipid synthase [Prauserella coralliicola]RBM24135.1 SAM-dependent methyltransferase [Prauserella sp. PE36]TKG71849.1 class I SAM-dependent methyltransferase [Prauserella endophytica]